MLDYSKYKYEQEQRRKAARKHQQQVTIREMKLRPKIATHDYETKKGHILRFLKQGQKVKVTIMFRGREMAHPERGEALLRKLADEIAEFGTIEQQPNQEGRNMTMVMAPGARPARKQERPARRNRRGRRAFAWGLRAAGGQRRARPAQQQTPRPTRGRGRLAQRRLALPGARAERRAWCACGAARVDAHAIAHGCSDPEVARWTKVPSPYTLEDARAWIAAARQSSASTARSCSS